MSASSLEGEAARVAHHFSSAEQQHEAGKMGMWAFLLTEVLFFSGLFCVYLLFRSARPEIFQRGSALLDARLGTLNTAVLLVSSMTMAWAVRCARLGQQAGLVRCLGLSLLCAFGFLGIKALEYTHKLQVGLRPGQAFAPDDAALSDLRPFFDVYFASTGLHALHVLIGIGVIAWILLRARRNEFSAHHHGAVENVALYWHLVDLVWIYLFPLLYLVG